MTGMRASSRSPNPSAVRPAPHLGHAPDDESERLEGRVAEGPGHLGQHAGRLRGRRRVVLEVVGEPRVEVDEVAVHRRRREVAQDPPGPVEPGLADDDVALGGPGEAELEGPGGGTELVVRGDPGAVDLLPHLEEARRCRRATSSCARGGRGPRCPAPRVGWPDRAGRGPCASHRSRTRRERPRPRPDPWRLLRRGYARAGRPRQGRRPHPGMNFPAHAGTLILAPVPFLRDRCRFRRRGTVAPCRQR